MAACCAACTCTCPPCPPRRTIFFRAGWCCNSVYPPNNNNDAVCVCCLVARFAAPSFGFQLLISGAPHDKLSSMLEKLRYHLSAGSYRPPLVEKTNYSSQAAAAGAGVLTNLKNKRSLDADGLSTRTASPDPRPRLRRACHRGSPSQVSGGKNLLLASEARSRTLRVVATCAALAVRFMTRPHADYMCGCL